MHAPARRTSAAHGTGCKKCHAGEVSAASRRGPKHRDCRGCHAEHTFAAPSCSSCHKPSELKGLHELTDHRKAKCTSCHNPHEKVMEGRAPCLSCHEEMRKHEPDGTKCSACHLFTSELGACP